MGTKGYKGFNKDLSCRGFQYEIGKDYETGEAKLCNSGFHACEYPLAVFGYYEPGSSRFAEVEIEGDTGEREEDTKLCGTKITVKAEIDLPGIIKAAVSFIHEKVDWKNAKESNTGDQSAATNTGDQSAATNTGDQSAAIVSGKESVAIATGFEGKSKGAFGCWIVCAEWEQKNGEYHIKEVKCAQVDGVTIKPDVFYQLKKSVFTECSD
jgi:hypothetical protein